MKPLSHQKTLFSGLDACPGQGNLFDDLDKPEPTNVEPAEPSEVEPAAETPAERVRREKGSL